MGRALSLAPRKAGGPTTTPCISRTSWRELSQPRAGLGEVISSSRSDSPKLQRRHHVHPVVPTPPPAPALRLPLRAGGRRAKLAARAGREEAAAPALAQNFCSRAGQLSKRSGDTGGTSALLPQ